MTSGLAELAHVAFALRLRTVPLRNLGACTSPDNAWIFLQGIETLPLRAKAHCENAQKAAAFLEKHPFVKWVNFAGLKSHPDYARSQKYFPMGPSAVFGFGLKGGLEAGKKFIESLRLFSHLANVGDARSLAIHPATTTHSQLSAEQQAAARITPDLVRLSVGLEHIDDILSDIDQALASV